MYALEDHAQVEQVMVSLSAWGYRRPLVLPKRIVGTAMLTHPANDP